MPCSLTYYSALPPYALSRLSSIFPPSSISQLPTPNYLTKSIHFDHCWVNLPTKSSQVYIYIYHDQNSCELFSHGLICTCAYKAGLIYVNSLADRMCNRNEGRKGWIFKWGGDVGGLGEGSGGGWIGGDEMRRWEDEKMRSFSLVIILRHGWLFAYFYPSPILILFSDRNSSASIAQRLLTLQ